MSEIRSIAEGTFVLGDTNGLTFEAGTGINITEPSEGTVRIGNDETVLWSGSWKPGNGTVVTNSAIEISESIDNFEYIRVVTEGILCQVITMTPNQCQALICYPESDSRTSTNFIEAYRSNSDWGYFTLKKIIGINRISGGSNE